jgi:endonuclease/exonuclease/phosphatase family metal-dependent hydrolase
VGGGRIVASAKEIAVAFRVMGFNTRLLPPIVESGSVDPLKLLWGEGERRAQAIGQAVVRDPWPDVIAFSEVWTDAERLGAKGTPRATTLVRDVLLPELASVYAFVTPMLPASVPVGLGKVMDSGLLLVSKREPIPFRNQLPPPWSTLDPRIGFALFPESAAADALAAKGVGVARFEASFGFVTIAFAHLQSAYAYVDEHWEVRQRQLEMIEALLEAAVGPRPWPGEEQVLLVGDLNIGAIDSPEYSLFFSNPNLFWGTNMHDGWATFNSFEDRGITQHSWSGEPSSPELQRNRLDYVFVYDPQPPFPPETFQVAAGTVPKLVAQHMRTTHRTLSDHYALCADMHTWHPYCQPLGAYRAPRVPPFRIVDLTDDAQMVWFRFDPGTYTFTSSDELSLTVYAADDLSDPWPPYQKEKVDLSKIKGTEGAWAEHGLSPLGTKYSLPKPFLVRATARADWHGRAVVGWHRHQGTSMLDAIGLQAHQPPVKTDFPSDRPLGDHDEQWFSAKLGKALSASEYGLSFYLDNTTREWAKLSLHSASGLELAHVEGAGSQLVLRWRDQGGDTLYPVVKRGRIGQDNFGISWKTSLSYLHPHAVRCDDETGIDWTGADEITLQVSVDGYDAGSRDWDDIDSGELRSVRDPSQPGVTLEPAGYLSNAEARVVEHDPDGDTSGASTIEPLEADEPTDEEAVSFDVGSGRYSFLYHRSHSLPGD